MLRTFALVLTCLAGLMPAVAGAQTRPVGADAFNLKTGDVPFAELDRSNFYERVVPIAKAEKEVVVYSFAAAFPGFWKQLATSFEAKYGIRVTIYDVKADVANQQLLAVHAAGLDAPVDVYFAGGKAPMQFVGTNVIGNVPLADLLPEAAAYDPVLLRESFGFRHGGTFMPFHRNQVAIGYNSARVKPADIPKDFAGLLAYAEAHPKRIAITSPLKGGSGEGILFSAALAQITDAACRARLFDWSMDMAQANTWLKTSGCAEPVWTWFRKILPLVELTNGNADTQSLIANGAADMGTVWEDYAYAFVHDKLLPKSFRTALLAPGLVGGGDGLFVVGNARHPAAAMLLIDFALDRDNQIWKLENLASRSARRDVTIADGVSEAARPFLIPDEDYRRFAIGYPTVPVLEALKAGFATEVLAKLP